MTASRLYALLSLLLLPVSVPAVAYDSIYDYTPPRDRVEVNLDALDQYDQSGRLMSDLAARKAPPPLADVALHPPSNSPVTVEPLEAALPRAATAPPPPSAPASADVGRFLSQHRALPPALAPAPPVLSAVPAPVDVRSIPTPVPMALAPAPSQSPPEIRPVPPPVVAPPTDVSRYLNAYFGRPSPTGPVLTRPPAPARVSTAPLPPQKTAPAAVSAPPVPAAPRAPVPASAPTVPPVVLKPAPAPANIPLAPAPKVEPAPTKPEAAEPKAEPLPAPSPAPVVPVPAPPARAKMDTEDGIKAEILPEPAPAPAPASSAQPPIPAPMPDEKPAAPLPAPAKPETPPAAVEKTPPLTDRSSETGADDAATLMASATPVRVPAADHPGDVPSREDLSLPFGREVSDLDGGLTARLDRIVAEMKDIPALRVEIRAYASAEGRNESDARRLSLARALTVRSYMAEAGVEPARLDVRALGSRVEGAPADRVDVLFVR